MQIQKLSLKSSKIQDLKRFYQQVIGLKLLKEGADFIEFKAGTTVLRFEQYPEDAYYHFAFNIPSFTAEAALEWLEKNCGLKILPFQSMKLVDFPNWNAAAIYFHDPAGNIVEFIARKNLNLHWASVFSANAVLNVSEIGLVTDLVEDIAQRLMNEAKCSLYSGDQQRFCAVGDEEGLFIIVDEKHKKWIPNNEDCLHFPLKVDFVHQKQLFSLDYYYGINEFSELKK